jgi:hypothetical protein
MSDRELILKLGEKQAVSYDKALEKLKSPKLAAKKILLEEYQKVSKDLIKFKNKSGLPVSKNNEEMRYIQHLLHEISEDED